MSGQITTFGPQLVGVVAANDGTAGGSTAAFEAAGVPVPPATGNDAGFAAAQPALAVHSDRHRVRGIATVSQDSALCENLDVVDRFGHPGSERTERASTAYAQ